MWFPQFKHWSQWLGCKCVDSGGLLLLPGWLKQALPHHWAAVCVGGYWNEDRAEMGVILPCSLVPNCLIMQQRAIDLSDCFISICCWWKTSQINFEWNPILATSTSSGLSINGITVLHYVLSLIVIDSSLSSHWTDSAIQTFCSTLLHHVWEVVQYPQEGSCCW